MNLREAFEKTETYKLCYSWQMDFDEEKQTWYSINPILISDCIAINAAWMMFQELKKPKASILHENEAHRLNNLG